MRLRLSRKHVPLLSTTGVCVLLYAAAAIRYPHFFSAYVFVNFFVDNAALGIVAVGMTFVILSGGIDLSVGSMVALSNVAVALLMRQLGVPSALAVVLVLGLGAAMGLAMGSIVRAFDLAPFIVTLAGLFFARGVALALWEGSVSIRHPVFVRLAGLAIPLGATRLPLAAVVFLAVVAGGICLSVWTAFGRNVYAIGGHEEAALLMGIPVGQTKALVYTLSGLCSALAGVVLGFQKLSGNPRAAVGMELDAIAAVVIGGTLLSGGVGYVFGTLVGVLIFGIIRTIIHFEGDLNPWWAKVVIGVLLLLFILLQKLLARPGLRERAGG
ncbi:MAG: galactofuranose ABC transporter, permease protein YjfF [Candidatus Brocadiia bacterium]